MVPDEPPSWDGHRETTFALIHPFAPFYSLLIKVNPDNPSSPTDFVCDLCTEMPKPTDGGKTYTFNIRKGVKFTDGTPLTAHDVVATYKKIIFPPEGTTSARVAFFVMVESVSAPRRPHRRVQAQVSVRRLHPGIGDAVQFHLLESEA